MLNFHIYSDILPIFNTVYTLKLVCIFYYKLLFMFLFDFKINPTKKKPTHCIQPSVESQKFSMLFLIYMKRSGCKSTQIASVYCLKKRKRFAKWYSYILTSSNKWYLRIRWTGFSRYDPSGNVWWRLCCVVANKAFVCEACSRVVNSDMASG